MKGSEFENQIDIGVVLKALLKDKILILSISSVFVLVGILFSLTLNNYYDSKSVLLVQDNANGNSLSGLSSITSMVGLNVGPQETNKTAEALATIKSRAFFNHLLSFDILPKVIFNKEASEGGHSLLIVDEYDGRTDEWNIEKPSYLRAHKIFIRDMLTISHELDTGLLNLKIRHSSPVFAKEISELIIREYNFISREKDLKEASDTLEYLKKELSNVKNREIKQSISSLIEQTLNKQVTAKLNKNYILDPLDPPYVPEIKAGPPRTIIVLSSFILGFILSCILVFFRHFNTYLK